MADVKGVAHVITLQSAAVATGNGTAMDTGGLGTVAVQITGITTATFTFEGTVDATNWVSVLATNLATAAQAATATADGIYLLPVAGLAKVRARISAWTSGTITATGEGIVAISPLISAPVSVTADTEFAAAAALADAASATPTTTTAGTVPLLMNATTVDRQRAVVNALDSTGTGIAAAGLVGQLDDTATGAVTENQFAPVRISPRRALLIEGVASATAVKVDGSAVTQPVSDATLGTTNTQIGDLTEAAPATDTASSGLNGRLQRIAQRITSAITLLAGGLPAALAASGGLKVDLAGTGVNATAIVVDTELSASSSLSDGSASNPSTSKIGAFPFLKNATTCDIQRAVVNALDSIGTGIAAAGLVAQFDETSPTVTTENQFAPVRQSARRALYIEPVGVSTAVKGAITLTDTTSTAVLAAGSGSDRNYVTSIQASNTSATAVRVNILDGATVVMSMYLAASGGGFTAMLPTPIKGTAATALNAQLSASVTDVRVSAQGYTGL